MLFTLICSASHCSSPTWNRKNRSQLPLEGGSVCFWRTLASTPIFSKHTLGGASTTAAANSNVPLSEILKMTDWSSPTFQTFTTSPFTFAHAVLHRVFTVSSSNFLCQLEILTNNLLSLTFWTLDKHCVIDVFLPFFLSSIVTVARL